MGLLPIERKRYNGKLPRAESEDRLENNIGYWKEIVWKRNGKKYLGKYRKNNIEINDRNIKEYMNRIIISIGFLEK